MKITISSTDTIVEVRERPCRLWQGTTESGIPVHVFLACIAVPLDQDTVDFDRELVGAQASEIDPDELMAQAILNTPPAGRSTGGH